MIEIRPIAASETWPMRHRVMWPHKPLEYIKLPQDLQGHHFGVFDTGTLVSVVSLFIQNNRAQFRKLATEVDQQGQGYASLLLEHLIAYTKDKGVPILWCNARTGKTKFYTKFKMYMTPTEFTKDGLDYVIMERTMDSPV